MKKKKRMKMDLQICDLNITHFKANSFPQREQFVIVFLFVLSHVIIVSFYHNILDQHTVWSWE